MLERPPGGAARAARADAVTSARALQIGVQLAPLSRYTLVSRRCGPLFGYAGYEPAALLQAVARGATLLHQGG